MVKNKKNLALFGIISLLIIIALSVLTCGSSNSAPSADQYKEVALRYLKAVADKDFDTFIKLDRDAKLGLKRAEEGQSGGPAFDRQQRIQRAINGAMNYEREQFLREHWIYNKIRDANLRVLEVKPENREVTGKPWATVFIEAQGKEKNTIFVELYYKNSEWTVDRCGIYRPGPSPFIRMK